MKFWINNEIAREFSWPVDAVADAFCSAMLGQSMRNAGSTNWTEKLENWPLERTLRDWLTSPDGFNASWEAEDGPDSFEELIDAVRDQLRPRKCKCGYQAEHMLDLDQHVLASMHLEGHHG